MDRIQHHLIAALLADCCSMTYRDSKQESAMRTAKTTILKRFTVLLSVASLSIFVLAEPCQNSPRGLLEFTDWQVSWGNSQPRNLYMGPDVNVWLVGQVGDYVAKLDPQTGDMQKSLQS